MDGQMNQINRAWEAVVWPRSGGWCRAFSSFLRGSWWQKHRLGAEPSPRLSHPNLPLNSVRGSYR